MLCESLLVFCHVSALIWTRTASFSHCRHLGCSWDVDPSSWMVAWMVLAGSVASGRCLLRIPVLYLGGVPRAGFRWWSWCQTCQKSGQENWCFILGRLFENLLKKKWNTKLLVKTVTFWRSFLLAGFFPLPLKPCTWLYLSGKEIICH